MTYEILLIVVIGGIGSVTRQLHWLVPVCGLLGMVAAFPRPEADASATWEVPLLRNGFRLVVFSLIIMVVVLFYRQGMMGMLGSCRIIFRKKTAANAAGKGAVK